LCPKADPETSSGQASQKKGPFFEGVFCPKKIGTKTAKKSKRISKIVILPRLFMATLTKKMFKYKIIAI